MCADRRQVTALVAMFAVTVGGCAHVPTVTEEYGAAPDNPVDATSPVAPPDPVGEDADRSETPDDVRPSRPEPAAPLLAFTVVEGAPAQELSSVLPVTADVVSRDGGAVLSTTDPRGAPALVFPAFSETPEPPRAILRLVPHATDGSDPLAPGRADFVFGANFAVDAESHGTEVDTGNNILQRGLASDPSHFKLEVDSRRPSCRIQGPQGVVVLRTEQRIEAERWHSVRCSRTGALVELTVFRLHGDSATLVESVRAEEATGDLQWKAGTPLSVGGKLAANGAMILSRTDQFNGLVAEPVFEIRS